jgi:hypothetical protein
MRMNAIFCLARLLFFLVGKVPARAQSLEAYKATVELIGKTLTLIRHIGIAIPMNSMKRRETRWLQVVSDLTDLAGNGTMCSCLRIKLYFYG